MQRVVFKRREALLIIIMYRFCNNNALYSTSLSFMFIVLLSPFDRPQIVIILNKILFQYCLEKRFLQKVMQCYFVCSLLNKKSNFPLCAYLFVYPVFHWDENVKVGGGGELGVGWGSNLEYTISTILSDLKKSHLYFLLRTGTPKQEKGQTAGQ